MADELLTKILHEKNLKTFQETLKRLAFYDKATATYQMDVFHTLKCLENDLKTIHQQELAAAGQDLQTVMLQGHGIPKFYQDSLAPEIVFYSLGEKVVKGSLTMNYGPSNRFLGRYRSEYCLTGALPPNERQLFTVLTAPIYGGSVQMCQPSASHPCAAPLSFVFNLDEPITTSFSLANLLLGQSDVMVKSHRPRLETIYQVTEKSMVNSQQQGQVYHWSLDSQTEAIEIRKIPFHHPSQLYAILKVNRLI